MSERRFPIGVLAVVPVVIGMGVWAFTGQAQVEDPAAQATATARAATSLTVQPTETPEWWIDSPPQWTPGPTETPWPTPATAERRGDFHDGAWVRVNAGAGDCLNARNQPSMASEWVIVSMCLPDGHEGLLSGRATEVDGHWWWSLSGAGWVAEEYLTYLFEFDARANVLSDLAGHGRIAFLRGGEVWVMRADGSEQRAVGAVPTEGNAWLTGGLQWSPDGTVIMFNASRYDTGMPNGTVDLHLLPVDGGEEVVYANTMGGGWSPDGQRIGIIREATPEQMGGGNEGVPGWLEPETGAQLVFGSERIFQDKPPSFNYDGSLLMISVSDWDDATQTSTRALVFYDKDGIEVQRVAFEGETYFASPRWSPVANRIALHVWKDGRGRYTIYDLVTASFRAEASPPPASDRIGGKCGGGDMWRTAWSDDGRHVLYSFADGDTGANGVWAWDVGTGEQRVVLASYAGAPSPGPGGAVMFSSGEHIFVGTTAGGMPRLLTEGSSPVWYFER